MSRLTRRRALAACGALTAWARTSGAQTGLPPKLLGEPAGRIPPVGELINAGEMESVAQRRLDPTTYSEVAGSERSGLEKITLHPRMMVDTRQMDLSSQLFGDTLFTPILVGPVAQQKRYHAEGELAMVRGASEAKAPVVISAEASFPIEKIAEVAKTPLWYQVRPDAVDPGKIAHAVKSGCKAVCVTVTAAFDWAVLDGVRRSANVPVVLKGVMSPAEAQRAVTAGMQGIVVSNYSPGQVPGVASSIEVLPAIADAVGGKIPILLDGSIRVGSDVIKALALGANAVLVARPAVWGLAAYGADGVQAVVELIQSGFARDMAMCGKVNLKAVDRSAVRIHRR